MQVLIVDDHPLVIAGCRKILSSLQDSRVGEAHEINGALERYVAIRPDVAIIDINLQGRSGFALMRQIMGLDPKARIVIFTMYDNPIIAARAIVNGAKGYVGKFDEPEQFLAAIRAAASGGTFLAPKLAHTIGAADVGSCRAFLNAITPRETQVLHLLAAGLSIKEIAGTVGVSYQSGAAYCLSLKHKLGARDLSELSIMAIDDERLP